MINNIALMYLLKDTVEAKGSERVTLAKKALNSLIQMMYENQCDDDLPMNIPELFYVLQNRPLKEYILEESIIHDNRISMPFVIGTEINSAVLEILEEDNPEEQEQKLYMKELLEFFRSEARKNPENTKIYEEQYRYVRVFFSKRAIYDSREMDLELKNTFLPLPIQDKIKAAYNKMPGITGSIYVCPVCGKVIQDNKLGICSNEICRVLIRKHNLKAQQITINSKAKSLSDGMYKYVLTPGIGEMMIYHNLLAAFPQYEVILYPEIDQYDIRICGNGVSINLDVKDVASPEKLVHLLVKESNLSKLTNKKDQFVFLVIPEHRIELYKMHQNNRDYVKTLESLLKSEGLNIRVLREKKVHAMIQKLIGEDE